jgi:hypothetical protein
VVVENVAIVGSKRGQNILLHTTLVVRFVKVTGSKPVSVCVHTGKPKGFLCRQENASNAIVIVADLGSIS